MGIVLAARQTSTARPANFTSGRYGIGASARPDYLRPVPTEAQGAGVAAELRRIGSTVNCPRGKTLVEDGDPAEHVFMVETGALRALRLLPDGRRYITNFLMPGDFFGLAEGMEYSRSLEAIADARLVRYQRRSFQALIERDVRAGRLFFDVLGKELSAAQDRLVLLGRKSAVERLASFLLALANRETEKGQAKSRLIELPMNRSDIADYLGLRIETVSRLLTELRKQRVVDLPDAHSFVLLDRKALEDSSGGY